MNTKMKWEIFEKNVLLFLNKNINRDNIEFKESGKSNSRSSDILVYRNKEIVFSIESKFLPSQCGQFVIEKTNHEFIESRKNFTANSFSNEILLEINKIKKNLSENFSLIKLKLNKNLMINWVKEHYSKKNVLFFIISRNVDKDFKIIRIDNIDKYFELSCVIRRKKSGSRDIPISKRELVIEKLVKHLKNENSLLIDYKFEGKSTIVTTNREPKEKYFGSKNFFLSKIENNNYKIKSLSSTNNLTVIFSVDISLEIENDGVKDFLISLDTL